MGVILITGETHRIMLLIGDIYYSGYYLKAFEYQIILFAIFISVFWQHRYALFSIKALPIGKYARFVVLSALICMYPIAYPAIFSGGQERFGSGGSLLIVLNTIIVLSRRDKLELVDYCCLALNSFALLCGERADTILIILLYYLTKCENGVISEKEISTLKLLAMLFFVMLLGIIAGINRMGGDSSFDLINAIFNQGTVIDVLHVYISSLWYADHLGVNIKPLINFFSSFVPFSDYGGASSEYNVTEILRSQIPNVGGGLYYSIGIMCFGFLGAVFVVYCYAVLLCKLFNGRDIYKVIFVALFIQQLRLQWYGLTYMGNVFIFGIFILSVIYLLKITSGNLNKYY